MEPKTLQAAIIYFSNPVNCRERMVARRWPNGVICPRCGSKDVLFLEKYNRWHCREKHDAPQFTLKTGTIMEDSPIGLDKWMMAMWMLANCKNGISSYEMGRDLGITQKSAWFLDHRIRLAMKAGSILKMEGECEADEAFIGGLAKNKHIDKRGKGGGTGGIGSGKIPVAGAVQRKGKVVARVIDNVDGDTLRAFVRGAVSEKVSLLCTDAFRGYRALDGEFPHGFVDHAKGQYVVGAIHTNTIEGFWSIFKRGVVGTFHKVSAKYLPL